MESNSSPAANPLSRENIGGLFDSVDAFLFDCDGVIWRGDSLVDDVAYTLSFLRSKGKISSKKFQSLGITVSEDEIFTSSFAAAMLLKVNNFPQDKKIAFILRSRAMGVGVTSMGVEEGAGTGVEEEEEGGGYTCEDTSLEMMIL